MYSRHRIANVFLLASSLIFFAVNGACAAVAPILLKVDARDVSHRVLHATLHIPAPPGPLKLVYPKWIPGEPGPSGPISDLTGLKMTAEGQPVAWQRDPLDHYTFQLKVPTGADAVDVALDFLLPSDPNGLTQAASSSANLVVISWNTLLLYPKGPAANASNFSAQLQLPAGWKFASALSRANESADGAEFKALTLETLIDSPRIVGAYLRTLDLLPGAAVAHRLNVVADSAAALEMPPVDLARLSKLVIEEQALFGARHYRKYDFLLTLSDQVAHFGLEHHESSDNRVPEGMLLDQELRKANASLLPHERVHSWNGKCRRPADLAKPG